jgi:Asp-tRNA(Asn)/Glu-tRNA(Gln) amidotransferase C subunit
VAIRDKLAARAAELSTAAAEAAVVRAQHAGARYRGLRAVFKDEETPITVETVLAGLVAAVRADEHEEDRSARDVFRTARSRRRRLGLLSFGAGPLIGVATHIVDLYCETATVCDLAELHSIDLSEQQVAAHMLVLWGILESVAEAEAVMMGTRTQTLASIIGGRMRGGVAEHIPDRLTKRTAIQVLSDARGVVADARKVAGTGSVGGVVFSGHRTKQVIKKAELQLGVPS